jgi:CheY-like chemotaxis protein
MRFPKPGENVAEIIATFERPVETAERELDERLTRRDLPRPITFCELPSYTDNPHFFDLLLLGYQVYMATNAAEALAILNSRTRIDILFTDIIMPNGMNGIALAREARRLQPDIRVLLASGYTRDRVEAEEGMAFIAKPYQMPELAWQLEAMRER